MLRGCDKFACDKKRCHKNDYDDDDDDESRRANASTAKLRREKELLKSTLTHHAGKNGVDTI